MNKLLSIIVPSYNMERYLRKCLTSICVDDRNLFDTLDVLVVNDGSTDGTSAIAHEFADRYPSVFRVIDKPNGHYGSCINRGLQEATGEFVRIIDADDSVTEEGFSGFLNVLQQIVTSGKPIDLVWSDHQQVDENGAVIKAIRYPLQSRDDLTLDDLTDADIEVSMPAITYRRSVFECLAYHQTEGIAYTDTEWIFTPMSKVRRILHFGLPVYSYLKGRPNQSTDMAALARQISMLTTVFETRLLTYRKSKESWSPAMIRYALRELSASVSYLYLAYLQISVLTYRRELRHLDQIVNTDLASVRDQIGARDSVLGIPYGKLCARHPIWRIPIATVFRLRSLFQKVRV